MLMFSPFSETAIYIEQIHNLNLDEITAERNHTRAAQSACHASNADGDPFAAEPIDGDADNVDDDVDDDDDDNDEGSRNVGGSSGGASTPTVAAPDDESAVCGSQNESRRRMRSQPTHGAVNSDR